MAYFQILRGLRGCYMPDSSYVIQCNTRRELKRALAWERDSDDSAMGLSNRAIAWAAAKAWRERRQHGRQSAILPFGYRAGERPFSIEIHTASRAEFLADQN